MKAVKGIISGLYEHYRSYHAYGPPRLKYMGYVGATTVALTCVTNWLAGRLT